MKEELGHKILSRHHRLYWSPKLSRQDRVTFNKTLSSQEEENWQVSSEEFLRESAQGSRVLQGVSSGK